MMSRRVVETQERVTDEDEVPCADCGDMISDGYQIGDDLFCEDCIDGNLEIIREEAWQYATDNCRITGKLPKYDSELGRWRAPKKYKKGNRESFLDYCREHHTNYDELVESFDDSDLEELEYCDAISERIDDLLKENRG